MTKLMHKCLFHKWDKNISVESSRIMETSGNRVYVCSIYRRRIDKLRKRVQHFKEIRIAIKKVLRYCAPVQFLPSLFVHHPL